MKKKIIKFIVFLIIFVTSLFLYSRYVATTGLYIKEYKIVNKKITDNFHGLKLVHISDIHYGRTIKKAEINKLVAKINTLKPDIVVLTGDLLDRDTKLNEDDIKNITDALKDINVKLNKYAIKGNHDYNKKEWESIIADSNFVDLNDNFDLIYNEGNEPIIINGMSTNLKGNKDPDSKLQKLNSFLNETENAELSNKYRIMIMHEPDYIKDFNYKDYDLILAGHSHNGQVRLPFIGPILLPDGAKKYYNEHYKLSNTELYISSGLGTSNLDFRLFNRPSFNFYRITNK